MAAKVHLVLRGDCSNSESAFPVSANRDVVSIFGGYKAYEKFLGILTPSPLDERYERLRSRPTVILQAFLGVMRDIKSS